MKKKKSKNNKKTILCILIGILIIISFAIFNEKYQKQKEQDLMQSYITCLENTYYQRDFCAKELGSDYHYLDLLLEKYNYTYKQVNKDIYLQH